MKRLTSVAVAFFLLYAIAAGGEAEQDKNKQETKLLEGTWKVTAAEMGGMKVGTAKLGIEQIVFAGNRVVWKKDGKDVANYAYTVDPGQKPKEMNLLKDKEKQPLPCIYAVDGDELKWCMPLPNAIAKVRERRPESFETKGRPYMLLTGRREKQ